MKTKLTTLLCGAVLFSYSLVAQADSVVQLWDCELREGKTRAELMEVSVAWINAVKAMDGAEEFEAYIEYPIVAGNVNGFTFVMVVGSAAEWGVYEDAYPGSRAEEIDQDWKEVAECSSSSLWVSAKIE